jgi:hypothetical protein
MYSSGVNAYGHAVELEHYTRFVYSEDGLDETVVPCGFVGMVDASFDGSNGILDCPACGDEIEIEDGKAHWADAWISA